MFSEFKPCGFYLFILLAVSQLEYWHALLFDFYMLVSSLPFSYGAYEKCFRSSTM
uniref:Uncharacterized protein n=1 Tax=Arundo donax TaxID=35708 RepID=A0A0A9ALP7_ARUDO